MSSTYDAYTKYNNLQEIAFIGGSEVELEFELYDEKGENINLISSSGLWLLSPYGQTSINIGELEMEPVVSGTGGNQAYSFKVTLPESLTTNLSGLYTQQIEIEDYSGKKFRPVKGTIVIHPAIPTNLR